jgi:hypothetical protein
MLRTDKPDAGQVVFSIELELAIHRPSLDRQQRLDHLARDLLGLFEQHAIPATWAVADPARSAASAAIRSSTGKHEIAVLGDRSWIGPGAGRLRIERELSRRFEGARRMGMPAMTLVLRNVIEPLDLGLLLAHQIRTVSYRGDFGGWQAPAAGGLRFGVWHAPAAWRLPMASRWWSPVRRQARRMLREANCQRRTLHVAIDGDALVDQQEAGLAQVRAVVEEVARLHAQGGILLATLGEVGAAELAFRSAQPSRSLLKPAA